MVDYDVNYEIVSYYSENSSRSEDLWSLTDYRNYKGYSVSLLTSQYVYGLRGYWGMYLGVIQNGTGYMVCQSTWVRNPLTGKPYVYPEDGLYASKYVELYGTSQLPIYKLQLVNWNGTEVKDFSIAYCAVSGIDWNPGQASFWELDHLTPQNIFNVISEADRVALGLPATGDWGADSPLSHNPLTESVFWLHDLGNYLRSSMFLTNILSFEVGGMSLLSLLITAGFLVYMSWALLKWLVPI